MLDALYVLLGTAFFALCVLYLVATDHL